MRKNMAGEGLILTGFMGVGKSTVGPRVAEVLDMEPGVISTGGGIVSTEMGRNALMGANIPVIWMQAPFVDLANRVANDNGRVRPLFEDEEKARALYNESEEWYRNTSGNSVNALQPIDLVVGDIIQIARSR